MVGAIGWLPWGLFGLHMLLQESRSLDSRKDERRSPKVHFWTPSKAWERNFLDFYLSVLAPIKWGVLVAVVLAMQIVTHTLLLIYSVYLIGAVVTWHFFETLRGDGWSQVRLEIKRLILPLLLVPILAGLLGAGQLLSLLELVEFSNRSLS